MSTDSGDTTPQLPPASKPTLPPAPKLSLSGGSTKPAFKPETIANVPGAPVSSPGFPKAPTLSAPATSATAAAPAASRAPLAQQGHKTSLASIKAVDDAESPKWLGGLSALALVASLAAAVLLFLELKPTL